MHLHNHRDSKHLENKTLSAAMTKNALSNSAVWLDCATTASRASIPQESTLTSPSTSCQPSSPPPSFIMRPRYKNASTQTWTPFSQTKKATLLRAPSTQVQFLRPSESIGKEKRTVAEETSDGKLWSCTKVYVKESDGDTREVNVWLVKGWGIAVLCLGYLTLFRLGVLLVRGVLGGE